MQVPIWLSLILVFCLDNALQLDVRAQPQAVGVGIIQGVVVSLPGTPIPNALVRAENMENMKDRIMGAADKDGKFTLNVHPGKWYVNAYKEDAGYPDCSIWFSGAVSEKSWQVIDVQSG